MVDKNTPDDKKETIATLDLEDELEQMSEQDFNTAFQADTSNMGLDGEELDHDDNDGIADGFGYSKKDEDKQYNDALSGASGKATTTFSVTADKQEAKEEERRRDAKRAVIQALMTLEEFELGLDDLLKALGDFNNAFEEQDEIYKALFSSYEDRIAQLQASIDLKQAELDKLIEEGGDPEKIAALQREIALKQQFLDDYQDETSDLTSDRNSLSIKYAELKKEHDELVGIKNSCKHGRELSAEDQERLEELKAEMEEIKSKLDAFKDECDACNKVAAIESPFMAIFMDPDRTCSAEELSALEKFREMRQEALEDGKLTQAEQQSLAEYAKKFSNDIGQEHFKEMASEIADKNIQVEQENGEFVSGQSAFDYLSNQFSNLMGWATAKLGAIGSAISSGVDAFSDIMNKAREDQENVDAETDEADTEQDTAETQDEDAETDQEAVEEFNVETPEASLQAEANALNSAKLAIDELRFAGKPMPENELDRLAAMPGLSEDIVRDLMHDQGVALENEVNIGGVSIDAEAEAEPAPSVMTFELFGQQVPVQDIPSASVPENFASYSDNPYRSVLDDYPEYNDPDATYMSPMSNMPSTSAVAGFESALSPASAPSAAAPDAMDLAAAEQRRLQEELERQRLLEMQNENDGPSSPTTSMA